MNEYVTH